MNTDPQPGQFSSLFVPPIEYGVPEYAEKMPFTCQPPSTWPDIELESWKNGNAYTKPICSTCVRSNPASAKFWSYMSGWFHVRPTHPSSSAMFLARLSV